MYFGDSGKQGYHLIFNSNQTLTVYKVDDTNFIRGYSILDKDWEETVWVDADANIK